MKREWSVEERESILDYLHGDVGHGVKACCYYEYARASEILRKDGENTILRVQSLTVFRPRCSTLSAFVFCSVPVFLTHHGAI